MTSRRNPFDELERALERMTEQLDADVGQFAGGGRGDVAVDVAARDEEYVVTADLPGYDREDIAVEVSDDVLTLRAERESSTESESGEFLRQERTHREVRRTVTLPGPVEEAEATATYQNGVLTVTLPRRGGGGGETIEVE